MENYDFFMHRLVDSLDRQTFRDFELVVTHEGSMPVNSNAAIKKAKGEIVKVLYLDDYLAPDALQNLSDNFVGGWLATGCLHDDGVNIGSPHIPTFTPGELTNTIGSPSVIAFENSDPILFDEALSWMLDVDLYQRLYERYGYPTLLNSWDTIIGIGSHQMTNILTDKQKEEEVLYVAKKYGTTY